jgi:hypothetical protein
MKFQITASTNIPTHNHTDSNRRRSNIPMLLIWLRALKRLD